MKAHVPNPRRDISVKAHVPNPRRDICATGKCFDPNQEEALSFSTVITKEGLCGLLGMSVEDILKLTTDEKQLLAQGLTRMPMYVRVQRRRSTVFVLELLDSRDGGDPDKSADLHDEDVE